MKILKIFSTASLRDEVRLELLKTQRELLHHQTVVENYTAAVEASKARILRLKNFLAEHKDEAARGED